MRREEPIDQLRAARRVSPAEYRVAPLGFEASDAASSAIGATARRALTLLAGMAVFAGLGVVAVHQPMPAMLGGLGGAAARMEARLQTAAETALAERGLVWASVEMDGQAAVLRGVAPREEDRLAARGAVLTAVGSGGFWRGGVTVVRDATRLAPPVEPYEWSAARDARGVRLAGAAPSEEARAELVEYATALFGDVVDEMEIARGAPDEASWRSAARTAIAQLAALEEGRAVIKDTRLRLEGDALDAAGRDRVVAAVSTLPGPYSAVTRVEAPPAPVDDAEGGRAAAEPDTITDPAVCQAMFDRLTAVDGVRFDSGRSVIDKESYALLDRLALAAQRCANAQVHVSGHTDSTGDPDANMRLSQNRAQAVVDYLILKGVAMERLAAEGFGDTRPIAGEDSAEGRARNRRIEFQIE